MQTLFKFTTVLVAALISTSALTQGRSPEQQAQRTLETRQAVFKLIANQNAPIGAMARGRAPLDLYVAEKQATRVAVLASMIPDTFSLDTREFDLDTEALPVIWDEMDIFIEKAQATVDAANAIVDAAISGDEEATKKAMGSIGRTCGGCHDEYRID